MSIGVRELKANLSEHLARAARGDEVVVTDRNRPIARIVPFAGGNDVDRGIEEGWVEAPRRMQLDDIEPASSTRSVLAALDEDRG